MCCCELLVCQIGWVAHILTPSWLTTLQVRYGIQRATLSCNIICKINQPTEQ